MSKVDITKILKRFELFNILSDYEKARLAAASSTRRAASKSNLSALYDTTQYAYFILDGVLALRTQDSRETFTILDLYKTGEFADVSDLYNSRPEDYRIISAKPTDLLVIAKSEIEWLLSINQEFNRLMAKMLVEQTRSLMARQRAKGALSLADQIKNYVIDNSTVVNGRRMYVPDVDYSIVCLILGCTRATTSRTIQHLVTKGFLKKEGKSLVLSDNLKHGTVISHIYGRDTKLGKKKGK